MEPTAVTHLSAMPENYHGRAFVYVLAMAGAEDLLKIGLSHDPLSRWSSFHPRWFEVFDLEHSLLVETETRQDAQQLETEWHRALLEHNCPMPLTMRIAAGGSTEWYRGAYARIVRLARACAQEGYAVHAQARPWLAVRMQEQEDRLDGWLRSAYAEYQAGTLGLAQRTAMRDRLDAHRSFDPTVLERLPQDMLADLDLKA